MRVRGEVRPPGDKSITHRALMLAGAIRGTSVVHGPLTSADARSTAGCLRSLGVRVSPLRAGSVVRVEGRRWHAPDGTLHCGNSGTTARLLLGFLAAHPFATRPTGDASLRRRPMRRVTEPLAAMGARFRDGVRDGLPITILNMKALGVAAQEFADGYRIAAGKMRRGLANSYGDHRIAMAIAVAGVDVDDPACAGISFPDFFDTLRSVR